MVKKTVDLHTLTKPELQAKLSELRKELLELRVAKVVAGRVPEKLNRLSQCQKDIARALTVVNERVHEELKQKYQGKKHIPKRMRGFGTRAQRRALTKEELKCRPARVIRLERCHLRRLYALKP